MVEGNIMKWILVIVQGMMCGALLSEAGIDVSSWQYWVCSFLNAFLVVFYGVAVKDDYRRNINEELEFLEHKLGKPY